MVTMVLRCHAGSAKIEIARDSWWNRHRHLDARP